jgi:hypothetical protein
MSDNFQCCPPQELVVNCRDRGEGFHCRRIFARSELTNGVVGGRQLHTKV